MSAQGILVTAHSGCMGTAPNSPAFLDAAFSSGADIVEVDIRFSQGGSVLLSHDPEVRDGEGRAIAVGSMTTEALRSMGDRAPLALDAVFDFAEKADAVLNLDVKEGPALILAAERARARKLRSKIIFSGLGEELARAAKSAIPDFRYLLNADDFLPAAGYGDGAIAAACEAAMDYGCCGINLDWRAATTAFVEYARRRCLPVFLWTADEIEDLAAAVEFRPYSITTNRPDALLELLEKRTRG